MNNLLRRTSRVLAFSAPVALMASFAAPANAFSPTFVNTSGDNGEETLQQILNDITDPSYDVNDDQDGVETFLPVDGQSSTTLVLELAGNDNTNTFGVYNPNDFSQEYEIFAGSETGVSTKTITFTGSELQIDGNTGVDFDGTEFGFYLEGANDTFYSEVSRNSDTDYMVSYQGNNSSTLDLNRDGNDDQTFLDTDYLLAWEDVTIPSNPNGEPDFNDMVVLASDVEPVPEPFTVLGSVTAIGVGGFLKRKYGKKA